MNRGDEALELETQWFAFRRNQLDSVDEARDVDGSRRRICRIDLLAKSKEFASACCEIERDVPAMLENANLPHSLPRNPTRCDVSHGAAGERHTSVGDVEHRR